MSAIDRIKQIREENPSLTLAEAKEVYIKELGLASSLDEYQEKLSEHLEVGYDEIANIEREIKELEIKKDLSTRFGQDAEVKELEDKIANLCYLLSCLNG